jgi:hypothetical protein
MNNMTEDIGPKHPTAQDYWNMLQNPGEHIKYQRYKRRVSDPSLMKVDEPNMPHGFDITNLHLHGLDVQVHMFDPVGTHNPDAPHIGIKPGECYCYKFHVPDHHPGTLGWTLDCIVICLSVCMCLCMFSLSLDNIMKCVPSFLNIDVLVYKWYGTLPYPTIPKVECTGTILMSMVPQPFKCGRV